IESDTEDCGGRIRAYTFQLVNFIPAVRNLTVKFVNYQLRGRLQMSGAAVIAESLPDFEHLFLFRLSKLINARKSIHKSFEIRSCLVYPCLLQHDLRDRDCIGVIGTWSGHRELVVDRAVE